MTISLSDIEQALVIGWQNKLDIDLSRLIEAGQTVTVIISDGPFTVPSSLPGGAVLVASKQHSFTSTALVLMRALTREE